MSRVSTAGGVVIVNVTGARGGLSAGAQAAIDASLDAAELAATEAAESAADALQAATDATTNGAAQVALAAQQADAATSAANEASETVSDVAIDLEEAMARLDALEAAQVIPVGGILEAEVMDSSSPVGQGINGNGKLLRIRFKGITASATVDVTKCTLTVKRPGFGADRIWRVDNIEETLTINGLYRFVYPNGTTKLVEQVGSDLDTYWALSEKVYVSDRIYDISVQAGFYGACVTHEKGVGENSSTAPYEAPVIDIVGLKPIERMTAAGLYAEVIVAHHGFRNQKMVAAVDIIANDNRAAPLSGNTSRVTVTTMSDSVAIVGQTAQVYAGTVPIGLLTSGKGGLTVDVYPWVSGPSPWRLSANGATRIDNTSLPAYWPVEVDLDSSYAPVRGYISHTAAQIGSPTVTTAALPAYDPGVTAAFANVAALAAAAKTFNNSGSRARPHNDCDAFQAVLPDGTIIAGFGGDLSAQGTYPISNGPLPEIVAAAGANIATTGITYPSNVANRRFRHLHIENCGIFPGASGSANHIVLDGNAQGASSTAPTNEAEAVILSMRGCVATGSGDLTNYTLYRCGYRFLDNCTFSALGTNSWAVNALFYQGMVIHGGSHTSSATDAVALADCGRIAGARLRQLVPAAEVSTRAIQFIYGQLVAFCRIDFGSAAGGGTNPQLGSARAAIGPRGVAIIGTLIRETVTSGANERPTLQIHADYLSSPTRDWPAMQNVMVIGCSLFGGRYNRGYLEIGDNADTKEIYEYFNAFEGENTKGDYMDPDAGGPYLPSGVRSGNFGIRFGTNRRGNRNALAGSNAGTGGTYSYDAWLGEVQAPGSAINIGSASMVVSNTGRFGSNNAASDGDFTPLAALLNAIPAGRAPYPKDLLGRPVPNDGTGAAGAVQLAA